MHAHTYTRQVLKVPSSNPLAWQTALIDSEVDCILSEGNSGNRKVDKRGGIPGGVGSGAAPPGQRREFLRRGSGRTSAGGNGSSKETGGDAVSAEGGGAGAGPTRRLDIVPGEVCPVCQEEMEEGRDEGGGIVAAAAAAAEGRLTYCRDGCGNNMHARWVGRSESLSFSQIRGTKSTTFLLFTYALLGGTG